MILSYSRDRFVDAIKDGTKIHTIRADPKRRWKPGMKIQHWRGNPRNVKQNPYQFAEGECKGVQEIEIFRIARPALAPGNAIIISIAARIREEDGWRWLTDNEVELLAKNDNLTLDEFREWFVPDNSPTFSGRIIHFTDFRY